MLPKQKIRLALFTDSLEPSGVGRVIETTARYLPRSRYELYFVCAAEPGADALAARMELLVCETLRCTLRTESGLFALPELAAALRNWRIDLFHNHIGATWEGEGGTIAARCADIPVVVATDHVPNLLLHEWEQTRRARANRLLDAVFAVSDSVRDSLCEAGLIPPEKSVTVENGIEPPIGLPSRAMARRTLNLPPDAPVAAFIGRMAEQKDPGVLVHAWREIVKTHPTAFVVFAGDGPARDYTEREAQRLGLAKRTRFLGHCAGIADVLAAADALAMPSRFEGLPLAALEAMAVGLPVVGCDVPGIRDVVAHNESGWLSPAFDYNDMAEGLRRSFTPEINRKWSAGARARYASRFTAQHMAQRHDAAYQAVLRNVIPALAHSED